MLKTCPTPWCDSNRVHTTTYFTSKKMGDNTISVIEIQHHCSDCHVTTPRLSAAEADKLWNDQGPRSGALDVLEEVKQACLIADDDGISITEDPHIPVELFDKICEWT